MKMKKDINLLAASGTKKKFDLKANANALVTLLIVIVVGACAYLYLSSFMKKRNLTAENQTLQSFINNPVHKSETQALEEKQSELDNVKNSIDSAKKILAYVNEQGDIYPSLTAAETEIVKRDLRTNGCVFDSITYDGASAVISATVNEEYADMSYAVAEAVRTALIGEKMFTDVALNYDVESGNNDFSFTVKLRNIEMILNDLFDNVTLKNFSYSSGSISFVITSTDSENAVTAYLRALKELEGEYFKEGKVPGMTKVTESTENVNGNVVTVYSIAQTVTCELLTRES